MTISSVSFGVLPSTVMFLVMVRLPSGMKLLVKPTSAVLPVSTLTFTSLSVTSAIFFSFRPSVASLTVYTPGSSSVSVTVPATPLVMVMVLVSL